MNKWLRLTEKRHLERIGDVQKLRRSFERKARLSFYGPRGASYEWSSLAHVPALRVQTGDDAKATLLYFHGGAYVMGSPRTHRAMIAHLCKRAGIQAIMPDYRKAPEDPFPAASDDALASYSALLEQGAPPEQIFLGGDSAGGGLALSLLGEICRLGLPRPKGLFGLSPFTDLTFSGASIAENAKADVVLPVSRLQQQELLYLQGHAPSDPRASPLFASFDGACPVWLTVGDTEILKDDALRMAKRLEAEGVHVTLEIERDLPHVWPMFHGYIPEAAVSLGKLARWINSL